MRLMSTPPSRKIRIALCITDLDIGGAERIMTELAIRMDKTRFEPVVYVLQSRPVREEQSCVPELEQAGIPVYFLDICDKWSLIKGFFKLRRLLLLQSPHLLQSFLFHANILGRTTGFWVRIPFRISGIRVAEGANRRHLLMDRMTQHLSNAYICVNSNVAEFTVEKGRIDPGKITVIENGVDVRALESAVPADTAAIESIPGSKKMIFIGRLHHQKGLDWFLATLPVWMRHLPDWELLLVGEGPEDAALKERIAQDEYAPFRNRIHFLGWRPDIPELLTASDLLVLPSRWEGMPNVVLQAMAARKPVLVSRKHAGCDGILANLLERQSFTLFDCDSLVSRLRYLGDDTVRLSLGEQNHRRVREHFSIERMVAAYESFWAHLVDG